MGPKIDPLTTRMAQTTTGLHSILSSATVYRLFQGLLGGHTTRTAFVRDQIRPFAGANILDIGCGPADVLDYLPATVNYWGFDISGRYITKARDRHGDRGRFFAKEFEPPDLAIMPPMDVAVATGLFHHLDDATAATLLATIRDALKPGGRLVVVSFHSLEDRMVKQFITARADAQGRGSRHLPDLPADDPSRRAPSFTLERKRATAPGDEEVAANPRARSASLRWATRTDAPAWNELEPPALAPRAEAEWTKLN